MNIESKREKQIKMLSKKIAESVDPGQIEQLLFTIILLKNYRNSTAVEHNHDQISSSELEVKFIGGLEKLVKTNDPEEVPILYEEVFPLLLSVRKRKRQNKQRKSPVASFKDRLANTVLRDVFSRIVLEGDKSNTLIITLDKQKNYYFQFTAAKGNPEIYCEAVSNFFLSEENAISEKKKNWLCNNGWIPPISSIQHPNYYRTENLTTDNNWHGFHKLLKSTSLEVYETPLNGQTHFELFFQ
jgi:hypothetical protein